MAYTMSSPTTDTGDLQLRERVAHLERLLADAGVRHGSDEEAKVGLRSALAYSDSIVDTVREPLLVLDAALRVRTASRSFYRTFAVSPEET